MFREPLLLMNTRHTIRLALLLAASLVASGPRLCAASGHGEAASSHAAADANDEIESPTGFRGIDLGEYSIRTYRSVSGQKNRVRFTLYATVKNEQVSNFRQLLKDRKNKIRDQVIIATRLVPIEDYDDPELKKIRRRIQLRLRRTLPELMIEDVFVSEFSLSVENS